ncbi:hypothetical protein AWB81_02480 [Caballeronia arationis]|jgi:hypothetical protein|uniref:NAD(P) transhydrogenase subunit beta n=1 Tax=Caballeronia arationis TaxID=1777142 RepID=A0A7Z7I544_9BURK|nr:hypothetical protein [Caballeronia arationis]SAK64717.1 hypothetical protein AWB81_02480 [Caballeronia arationis]SOE63589.1 hypothetical protein SAMN05446927_2564 [Caballeronia arationis]
MFDALDGALCVLAVVAMMEALRATGGISAARRRVLWEIGAMGAGIVLAHAASGSATAVLSMIVALGIAGGAAAVCARFRIDRAPRLSCLHGMIAAAALASTPFAKPDEPVAALIGGSVALAGVALVSRLRFAVRDASLASSLHFACAGVCAVIGYAAGREAGALAVVIVSATAALISSHLTMALAGPAWPGLVSTLNGFAACSVVAVGIFAGSGALLVTGIALAIGCAASHASAMQSRASYSK